MNEATHAFFKRFFWGIGVGAIIIFAFSQPLLRFVDAMRAWETGILIGGTVTLAYTHNLFIDKVEESKFLKNAFDLLLCAAAAFAMVSTSLTIIDAANASQINERRCAIIEIEMLRGKPRRSDLPDLFQSLGCRPQTILMPKRPATQTAD